MTPVFQVIAASVSYTIPLGVSCAHFEREIDATTCHDQSCTGGGGDLRGSPLQKYNTLTTLHSMNFDDWLAIHVAGNLSKKIWEVQALTHHYFAQQSLGFH
jgi:hypothetical protein